MPPFSHEAVEHSADPVTAQEVSTSMARHSLVWSSMRLRVRIRRPSASWSLMKSIDQRSLRWRRVPAFPHAQGRLALLSHRDLELLLAVDAVDALVVVAKAITPKRISQQPVAPAPSLRRRSLQRAPEELVVVRLGR